MARDRSFLGRVHLSTFSKYLGTFDGPPTGGEGGKGEGCPRTESRTSTPARPHGRIRPIERLQGLPGNLDGARTSAPSRGDFTHSANERNTWGGLNKRAALNGANRQNPLPPIHLVRSLHHSFHPTCALCSFRSFCPSVSSVISVHIAPSVKLLTI